MRDHDARAVDALAGRPPPRGELRTAARPSFRPGRGRPLSRAFDQVGWMITTTNTLSPARPTLRGHVQIARIDHWFKNVFVLPGIVTAIGVDMEGAGEGLGQRFLLGMISICLVASSNYVINEVLDADSDRSHPIKRK